MALNARKKGQRGERGVIELLQPIVDEVRLTLGIHPILLQRNAMQAHLGGEDLVGVQGFSIEVKFVEQLNINSWWDQALRQAEAAGPGIIPVLLYRASRQQWNAMARIRAVCPTGRLSNLYDVRFHTTGQFLHWFKENYTSIMMWYQEHSPSSIK